MIKTKTNLNQLNIGSFKKFWFNCNRCEHEFEITLSSVNLKCWCQYCVNIVLIK